MGKEIIPIGDIKAEKHKFHEYKSPVSIYGVNIDRRIISNNLLVGKKGFKYFIRHKKDDEKVIPLCIMLPKIGAYRKGFDESKLMSFLIKDNELLEKYNEIWGRVSNTIKK